MYYFSVLALLIIVLFVFTSNVGIVPTTNYVLQNQISGSSFVQVEEFVKTNKNIRPPRSQNKIVNNYNGMVVPSWVNHSSTSFATTATAGSSSTTKAYVVLVENRHMHNISSDYSYYTFAMWQKYCSQQQQRQTDTIGAEKLAYYYCDLIVYNSSSLCNKYPPIHLTNTRKVNNCTGYSDGNGTLIHVAPYWMKFLAILNVMDGNSNSGRPDDNSLIIFADNDMQIMKNNFHLPILDLPEIQSFTTSNRTMLVITQKTQFWYKLIKKNSNYTDAIVSNLFIVKNTIRGRRLMKTLWKSQSYSTPMDTNGTYYRYEWPYEQERLTWAYYKYNSKRSKNETTTKKKIEDDDFLFYPVIGNRTYLNNHSFINHGPICSIQCQQQSPIMCQCPFNGEKHLIITDLQDTLLLDGYERNITTSTMTTNSTNSTDSDSGGDNYYYIDTVSNLFHRIKPVKLKNIFF